MTSAPIAAKCDATFNEAAASPCVKCLPQTGRLSKPRKLNDDVSADRDVTIEILAPGYAPRNSDTVANTIA
jgi:hypothetical protein